MSIGSLDSGAMRVVRTTEISPEGRSPVADRRPQASITLDDATEGDRSLPMLTVRHPGDPRRLSLEAAR